MSMYIRLILIRNIFELTSHHFISQQENKIQILIPYYRQHKAYLESLIIIIIIIIIVIILFFFKKKKKKLFEKRDLKIAAFQGHGFIWHFV